MGFLTEAVGSTAGTAVFYYRNSEQKRMTRKTCGTSRERNSSVRVPVQHPFAGLWSNRD